MADPRWLSVLNGIKLALNQLPHQKAGAYHLKLRTYNDAGIFGQGWTANATAANDGNGRDADASDPGDWVSTADTQTPQFSGCTVANSSWHGTRVTGILGALTNNGTGLAGMTWVSFATRQSPGLRISTRLRTWLCQISPLVRSTTISRASARAGRGCCAINCRGSS